MSTDQICVHPRSSVAELVFADCQNASQTKLIPAGQRCAVVAEQSWAQAQLNAASVEFPPQLNHTEIQASIHRPTRKQSGSRARSSIVLTNSPSRCSSQTFSSFS